MSIKFMVWAWELHLPASTKLVLLALADHADDHGICWPGIVGVAEKCTLSERSVQRHVQDMVSRGLLRVEERFRPDGSRSSNRYHLLLAGGGDIKSPGGCQADRGLVTESHHPVTTASPLDTSLETSLETTEEISLHRSVASVQMYAREKPKADTKAPTPSDTTWNAYRRAYRQRYSVDPIRNSCVNGQVAHLLGRLGAEEAPLVAGYYLTLNDRQYIQCGHSIDALLRNWLKLRTDWMRSQQPRSSYVRL